MNILALVSGPKSIAAALLMKKRGHKISSIYYGDNETYEELSQYVDSMEVEYTSGKYLPAVVFHAANIAQHKGYDALCVGLHYSNHNRWASSDSVYYIRRLLESTLVEPIKLLTPVYDISKEDILSEVEYLGFTSLT